jgi:deoxyribodipyrimidine photo-lyase
MRLALLWFRSDLRLRDNAALHAACRGADAVVPVFIFDPVILGAKDTGAPIVGFMLECLRELARDLAEVGVPLTFRHGEPVAEMRRLLRETSAVALYYNRDYEPMARRRDAAVEKLAASMGVEVRSFKDGVLHEAGEVLKGDSSPYKVFSAYRRAWNAKPKDEALPPARLPRQNGMSFPRSLPLPSAEKLGFKLEINIAPGGENAGRQQLASFVRENLTHYAERRNLPALGATSRLSPHIRLGTVSVRTILAAARKSRARHPEAQRQIDTFIGELTWRDFYRQILWHFPHVADAAFRPAYDGLKWENDRRLFRAWCEGRTGFPLVDAGMRQLNATGWMHNRLRMITASFLCKDLLISYKWGELYFMQRLMDADLAQNNGGWQWCAGTGTDAQPWFRIFNPTAQTQKFDPKGDFIRRFVPELETRDYPAPIVEHAKQRAKALAMFRAVR